MSQILFFRRATLSGFPKNRLKQIGKKRYNINLHAKSYLQGKVIKGEAVGRTIGFPTANLKLTTVPKVKPGVYTLNYFK